MAGGGSGEEENYWPGFVDALTTMTMVLTFVMMILAISIANLSQNISRSLLERIAKAADKETRLSPDVPLDTLVDEIIAIIERAKRRPPPVIVVPPEEKMITPELVPEKPPESKVSATSSPSMLTLNYEPRAVKTDESAIGEIKSFVEGAGLVGTSKIIEVRAAAGTSSGSLTEARRTAYYRAMIVRGNMIAAGVPPTSIRVKVEEVLAEDKSTEVVKIFVMP